MKNLINIFAIGSLSLTAHASGARAPVSLPVPVNASTLAAEALHIDGHLIGAWRIHDHDGTHILILTRKAGPSPAARRSGRVGKIDLAAVYYQRLPAGQWQQEWTIRDGSDCPELDVEADFFKDSVTFTDLNQDGRAEVTVPFRLFCGGGVDPHAVKVILREGSTKLAIRGESVVRYPGQAPFGGGRQHDKVLLTPARAAYKQHMDTVWRKVADDVRK